MIPFLYAHPILGVIIYLVVGILGVFIRIHAKRKGSKFLWGLFIACCVFVGTLGTWIFYLSGGIDRAYRTMMGGIGHDSQLPFAIAGFVYFFAATIIGIVVNKEHEE